MATVCVLYVLEIPVCHSESEEPFRKHVACTVMPRFSKPTTLRTRTDDDKSPRRITRATMTAAKTIEPGSRWQWSFRAHMVALVIGCVLPLAGLAVVTIRQFGEAQREIYRSEVIGAARSASAAVDQQLYNTEKLLSELALLHLPDADGLPAFYERCLAVAEQYQGWILLTDPSGNQQFNTRRPFGAALPRLAQTQDFRIAVATRERRISDLSVGTVDRQSEVAVYVPIARDDRAPLVLAMAFPPEAIAQLLAAQGYPPEWAVFVIDRQGTMIARHGSDALLAGAGPGEQVPEIVAGKNGASYRSFGAAGIAAYGGVARSPLSGWRVVVSVPEATVDAPLWRSLGRFALLGLGLSALALGTAFAIAQHLTNNLKTLAGAASALGRREPLPLVVSTVREVSGVASTLSHAAAELAASDQQLRNSQDQLLHAQKLEALGTLAGGIAHDLNNTLVPVIGLTKLMMKRWPDERRGHANMDIILQAGERGRDLVRQILAFSRKEKPARQPLDVAALVRKSLKMLTASLPSTLHIEEAIEDVPPMSGDASQLDQIVLNLVVNAAQAIGGKIGTIRVVLRCDPPQPLDGHPERQSGAPVIHLSVSDTGCGMDEATAQHVFEPFFTTKPVGEGTGLGLSVVHGIVLQHDGRISVESRVGQGTCFDVYFPSLSRETPLLGAA
jgi:signal transduction histidine kinase